MNFNWSNVFVLPYLRICSICLNTAAKSIISISLIFSPSEVGGCSWQIPVENNSRKIEETHLICKGSYALFIIYQYILCNITYQEYLDCCQIKGIIWLVSRARSSCGNLDTPPLILNKRVCANFLHVATVETWIFIFIGDESLHPTPTEEKQSICVHYLIW